MAEDARQDDEAAPPPPAEGKGASVRPKPGLRRRSPAKDKGAVDRGSGAPPPPVDDERGDAYRVSLPTFEGPLDLLLHLIQKHELDILNIPVSFVTEKYLEYLAVMRSLTIDLASEYLVMAATLTHIKSKMLLPDLATADDDQAEDEEEDPRADLIRRLLEYQKYKAAAESLGARETLGKDVFPRGEPEPEPTGPAPFASLGTFDLLDAFAKILERTKSKIEHEVVFDRISISDRISELTDVMKLRRSMPFTELFERHGQTVTRFDVVITFLAMLEMARLKMARIYQSEPLASIFVELLVLDEDAQDDDPMGGGGADE